MDYQEAKETLGKRTSRKIRNNTYLKLRDGGAIAVMLYNTDVVTFFPDGTILLRTGGWNTMTTFERINTALPANIHVWSCRGTRRLHVNHKPVADFVSGMVINGKGKVVGYLRHGQFTTELPAEAA